MAKTRVNALSTYTTSNSLAFIYPLLINRPFFNGQGIKFSFHDRLNEKIYNCDILFINSKFFREWHAEKEQKLYDVLADFKKRIPRVIWFDTTDSTGTTQFNVMPYVDGYYKSQLLKDRSLYTKVFYGYRIFTDYYKSLFSEKELPKDLSQIKALSVTLQPEHAHKLHLSWNSAMYDWSVHNFFPFYSTYGGLKAKIQTYFPFRTNYGIQFIKLDRERNVNIIGRIGLPHKKDTGNIVKYQRERIAKILKGKFNVDTSTIPRWLYLREIKNSKVGVSPFGLGEMSSRDFEIIINGALLFKQDMSHLETWPPLYVGNETYVPFTWDLKDFEQKLNDILKDEQKIRAISKKAQTKYAYYLYGNGRFEFCEKIKNILNRIIRM